MKIIKQFFFIACLASTQISYTAENLTAKEIQLIMTNRVLNRMADILKPVEKAKDWSIFNAATVPSKSEAINIAAPLFEQALQDIITEYALCYEITTVKSFGFVEVQEVCITDNKETGLHIMRNQEFMKLLEKAIKLFEVETIEKPFIHYTAQFLIQTTGTKKLSLHEIKEAIERVSQ